MYNIAICGQRVSYRIKIRQVIEQYGGVKPATLTINEYSSADELFHQSNGIFDLVFINLSLSWVLDLAYARKLRKRNDQMVLIFCSESCYLTPEMIKAQPYRLIIKDNYHRMLITEIPDIIKEMQRQASNTYLTVSGDGKVMRIPTNNILYMAVIKRGTKIVLDQGSGISEEICRQRLKELYGEVRRLGFEYAHNSYIVNFSNIIRLEKTVITMKYDIILNISRSKKEMFDQAFEEFLHFDFKRNNN